MAMILLIDDDRDFSEALQAELEQQEHEVEWLDSAEAGLSRLESERINIDLILCDNRMPRNSGLEPAHPRDPDD